MSNEVYAFALKSTLNEIQNACPDVTSNFIFKDGEILAKDRNTEEENATQTLEAFDAITERADPLGEIENISIQSAEGKVNIAAMNDFYLTTVSSNEADEKYVNTLTRVLIPIVIKLSEKFQSASIENEPITTVQPEPEEDDAEKVTDEFIDDETPDEDEANENEQSYEEEPEEETAATEPYNEPVQESEIDDEPLIPDPPVTQLIVENLGGLLVPSDTIRVDQEIINQWNELYGDNKINEVEVEALNGKTTRCKFKHIKKSKDTGKGIIKMPEKMQLTLEIAAGELVTVKPIIE